MTDHDLEQRLRTWYRRDGGEGEMVPEQLRADLASLAETVANPRRTFTGGEWFPSTHRFAPFALAAAAIAAIVIAIGLLLRAPNVGPPPPQPDPARPGASNGWIAYATAPADYDRRAGFVLGSDIYLVREGVDPRLLADRNGGDTWNVCPVFSPGGRMLAFGQETPSGRAIVVVGVDASGLLTEPNLRLSVVGAGQAPCPRWSSDGTRVAYVEGADVLIRGLDGSSPSPGAGDPVMADFARNSDTLRSPVSDLVARNDGDSIVVSKADGSLPRTVRVGNHYALGTWSPDGTQILYLRDVSGMHFTLFGVSVNVPYDRTTMAEFVPVNHSRSWPGNGDVSWQPVFAAVPEASANAATWTAIARMNVSRSGHTATLLSDGRVLVAGGSGSATAELYDPDSGTWTSTGNMSESRQGHTATLLPDGRVLVAGGISGRGDSRGFIGEDALATAELYDPVRGSWTATGSMHDGRRGLTATLLPDGLVLVTGGDSVEGTRLHSAELYDPRNGTWTATGSMVYGRGFHTAALLRDGSVLVVGTHGSLGDKAEIYDPDTRTWTETGSLMHFRVESTATVLPDGRVLVIGSGEHAEPTADLYDPNSGTWVPAAPMFVARANQTATLLPDGTVLVSGGRGAGNATELYDPSSGTWMVAASMTSARAGHTATLLLDGTVLVAGGSSSAELYDPG